MWDSKTLVPVFVQNFPQRMEFLSWPFLFIFITGSRFYSKWIQFKTFFIKNHLLNMGNKIAHIVVARGKGVEAMIKAAPKAPIIWG